MGCMASPLSQWSPGRVRAGVAKHALDSVRDTALGFGQWWSEEAVRMGRIYLQCRCDTPNSTIDERKAGAKGYSRFLLRYGTWGHPVPRQARLSSWMAPSLRTRPKVYLNFISFLDNSRLARYCIFHTASAHRHHLRHHPRIRGRKEHDSKVDGTFGMTSQPSLLYCTVRA